MKQRNFFRFFTARTKLSLRSLQTGQELWHIFISRGNLILSTIAFVLLLFVSVLTIVAYTSILDLVPGYPGNRSRQMLISSIAKLDSLEHEVRSWERYTYDLQLILDGRVKDITVEGVDSTTKSGVAGNVVSRTVMDSIFRASVLSNVASHQASDHRRKMELTFEMITPVKGIVERKFAPAQGFYGVELNAQPNTVVLAVMDGTVVLNSWSPKMGSMVVIQHAAGMMSIYKGLAQSLLDVDGRVKAGQGVGVSQSIKDGKLPNLIFELWISGNAVDPQNYITF